MLNSYKAYIFDVDGTILDTAPCILESISQSLTKTGIAFDNKQITQELIGPKIGEIVDLLNLKINFQQKEEIIQTFRRIYDENPIGKTQIYPQIQFFLSELKNKNCKLFIATNKPKRPLQKLLEHFSLNNFEEIYTPDKYPNKIMSKAEMIAEILKKHNLAANTTLFIGDTQGDYQASTQNHCPFAFASWGYEKDKKTLSQNSTEILN